MTLDASSSTKSFSEKYVRIKNEIGTLIPFRPTSKQAEFFDAADANQKVICLSSRRQGMTTALIVRALKSAVESPGKIVVTASANQNLASSARNEFLKIINSDEIKSAGIEVTVADNSYVRLSNASTVFFQVAQSRSIIGVLMDELLISDLSLIPLKAGSDFIASAIGGIKKDGKIIIESGKSNIENVFDDIWLNAGERGFVKIFVPWNSFPTHDAAWKTKMISMVGQKIWNEEFEISE